MKKLKNLFTYKVTKQDLLFSFGMLTGLLLASVMDWLVYEKFPKVLLAVCLVWSVQLVLTMLDYCNRIWDQNNK